MRAAFFGGIYNNHLALAAAMADARARGVDALYCLGDVGGFGPHPDRSLELLRASGMPTVQGNYDHSIGLGLEDCGCGYTDPRDNHFARISYAYTQEKTSSVHRPWLAGLPERLSVDAEGTRLVMVHGSPRQQNEFLWESTTPDPFLERLLEQAGADVLLCTHTGLHWQRRLRSGRRVVNVGALGRPANDGATHVWYALLDTRKPEPVELIPVAYDFHQLVREMREERLPEEFVETILTGWWTTCLEILPARERLRGRY
ncbi:metallophosphoesterase family protein [Hyalangium gracile]|uniref:metallophosphoesterase family protein n=1 Tax=Hyalangium gracile TaxID=394092 RepID=UPI001CCBF408|nr:metallophosphoesterase family protein [Hyalangium gracile]